MDADLLFAAQWIDAWNTRDLDKVMGHYSSQVVFLSPLAERRTGSGRIVGLQALRAYWRPALDAVPDLRFELETVLSGAECLTILYRNQHGRRVAETMEFDAHRLVIRSYACYAS
jgi:hypothetical protein